MRVEVTPTAQAERLINAFENRIPKRLVPDVYEALRISARDVAKETRRLLRSKRGGVSLPGQAPARQTGALAKSIRFKRSRRAVSYSVFNQSDQFYARFLELGTDERFTAFKRGRASRGRIEPRPFLTAALESRHVETQKNIERALVKLFEDFSN